LIPRSNPDALRRAIEQVLKRAALERPEGDTGEQNIEEVFELYQEPLKEKK